MTRLVRAANAGPMTLDGTNTWLVGTSRVLVVDPGPADEDHVGAVLAEVTRDGGRLGGVLLTHRHGDHADALGTAGWREAVAAAAVPVLAGDVALGADPGPGALRQVTDEPCHVLRLPGHTDDSLALVLPGPRAVLTGDTVLGRGTPVVAHPDGDLDDYLASLRTLLATLAGEVAWTGLPGHGPVVPDLAAAVEDLLAHRLSRVAQVRAALTETAPMHGPSDLAEADDATVTAIVDRVYPDLVDPALRAAAAQTVRATLVHLSRATGAA